MKRFFIILCILILLMIVAAGIGYVQLRLPANTYGVVYTKTGAWHEQVIQHGTFTWMWEFLFPTNSTLYTYSIAPHRSVILVDGELPAADVYRRYLLGSPDFTYSLQFAITYAIRPEELPALAKNEGLLPETIDTWYRHTESTITSFIHSLVENSEIDADRAWDGIDQQITTQLALYFSHLEIRKVALEKFDTPDFRFYQLAQDIYERVRNNERITEAVITNEIDRIQSASLLYRWQEVGKLLNSSPQLVDFLQILKDADGSLSDITDVLD